MLEDNTQLDYLERANLKVVRIKSTFLDYKACKAKKVKGNLNKFDSRRAYTCIAVLHICLLTSVEKECRCGSAVAGRLWGRFTQLIPRQRTKYWSFKVEVHLQNTPDKRVETTARDRGAAGVLSGQVKFIYLCLFTLVTEKPDMFLGRVASRECDISGMKEFL